MKPENRQLLREQIDRWLMPFRRAGTRSRTDWVRAVREALGMNGRQLADRMGISRSHLAQIERAEARGATSLRTLERVANALDCDLVYAFVPRDGKTLEQLVRDRAVAVAERRVERVSHTMVLEAQAVDESFQKREVERIAAELVRSMSKELWEP